MEGPYLLITYIFLLWPTSSCLGFQTWIVNCILGSMFRYTVVLKVGKGRQFSVSIIFQWYPTQYWPLWSQKHTVKMPLRDNYNLLFAINLRHLRTIILKVYLNDLFPKCITHTSGFLIPYCNSPDVLVHSLDTVSPPEIDPNHWLLLVEGTGATRLRAPVSTLTLSLTCFVILDK